MKKIILPLLFCCAVVIGLLLCIAGLVGLGVEFFYGIPPKTVVWNNFSIEALLLYSNSIGVVLLCLCLWIIASAKEMFRPWWYGVPITTFCFGLLLLIYQVSGYITERESLRTGIALVVGFFLFFIVKKVFDRHVLDIYFWRTHYLFPRDDQEIPDDEERQILDDFPVYQKGK